jgi:transposase
VVRIDNTPSALAEAVTAAGDRPQVVLEATYGWYWALDVSQELGPIVHLANPNALNWGERRVKNDVVDATDLADMLRLGRLPEAWIAPPALRELRELVRYRAKLVQLRSGLKAQVHAVTKKASYRRWTTCSAPAAKPSSMRWNWDATTRSASSRYAI